MDIRKYRIYALIIVLFVSPSYAANNKAEEVFDLQTISCEKLLSLKEQSRDYLFFFLYGFSAGLVEDYEHSVNKIERAVEIVGNKCSENKKMKAVDVINSINNK